MTKVLKRLGVELPEYSADNDPTKQKCCDVEWTISPNSIKEIDEEYKKMVKMMQKRKSESTINVKPMKKEKKIKSEVKTEND